MNNVVNTEDEQCSRIGCSKKALMKPPSALVLLPVANKNKVLTYCKSRLTLLSTNCLLSSNICLYGVCQKKGLFLKSCSCILCVVSYTWNY